MPRKIETPDQWYNIPGWLTYGARHLNRLGARTTRALSQFYTTYSPAFFLFSNFARDFSGAFAYNSAEKSIAEARQIAALAPDSFAAMRRYIRGESKNKRYTIEEIESFFGSEPKLYDDFYSNLCLRRAVERNIEIIGEAMNRILKADKDIAITNSRKIVDARNYIIHGYDSLSVDILWSMIINHLPKLKNEVTTLLNS